MSTSLNANGDALESSSLALELVSIAFATDWRSGTCALDAMVG
ncbi:hypothetical protein [Pseudothauera nasutitermitis]|nr:hypothetical protein [Pseudothauera nasutitermitis]